MSAHLFYRRRPFFSFVKQACECRVYIGALWGEWFDWVLLQQVAKRYPDASVVVIGDYRGQCHITPPNLYFIGLKAQRELPAYLAHTNVAIIPWKINKITQATSPLKLYEYLAMRCPVVAPDLIPLQKTPGVFLAQDAAEFIDLIDTARHTSLDSETISKFIEENNWHKRVSYLMQRVKDEHQENLSTSSPDLSAAESYSL